MGNIEIRDSSLNITNKVIQRIPPNQVYNAAKCTEITLTHNRFVVFNNLSSRYKTIFKYIT